MNPAAIAEVVTLWLMVNVGAMVVLAVASYAGSVLVLDGLEALDKWMYAVRYKRGDKLVPENPPAASNEPEAL